MLVVEDCRNIFKRLSSKLLYHKYVLRAHCGVDVAAKHFWSLLQLAFCLGLSPVQWWLVTSSSSSLPSSPHQSYPDLASVSTQPRQNHHLQSPPVLSKNRILLVIVHKTPAAQKENISKLPLEGGSSPVNKISSESFNVCVLCNPWSMMILML